MTRESEGDEFEGIDINGPWGGIRIGSGGVRVGGWPQDDWATTTLISAVCGGASGRS